MLEGSRPTTFVPIREMRNREGECHDRKPLRCGLPPNTTRSIFEGPILIDLGTRKKVASTRQDRKFGSGGGDTRDNDGPPSPL
jgi:hypothetical protein